MNLHYKALGLFLFNINIIAAVFLVGVWGVVFTIAVWAIFLMIIGEFSLPTKKYVLPRAIIINKKESM